MPFAPWQHPYPYWSHRMRTAPYREPPLHSYSQIRLSYARYHHPPAGLQSQISDCRHLNPSCYLIFCCLSYYPSRCPAFRKPCFPHGCSDCFPMMLLPPMPYPYTKPPRIPVRPPPILSSSCFTSSRVHVIFYHNSDIKRSAGLRRHPTSRVQSITLPFLFKQSHKAVSLS